ncbi:MAG: hypothetical protein ABFR97_03920 [Thermodesulfobacteriota bacterium]
MIHPATIGFDLDCVVVDTMEAFIRLAWTDHGIRVRPEEITHFQVEECLTMADTTVNAIFAELLADPLGTAMRPMAGAVEVLAEMASMAPLTFITARPEAEPMAAWLDVTLGPEIMDQATLVAMGDHDGKARHIKAHGLTTFIDDRFETCELLQQEGIRALVFDQPWNKGRHDLPTVASWQEIGQLINYEP